MTKFIILFIIILAVGLRFYQLGSNPPSLDWDEASLGYNAYSILKTGADEYGNKFPLSIRSFDDYKPPLYVYLAVPSIAAFDLTEFAVRLPSAVVGVLGVIITYFLVLELFIIRKDKEILALLSAFFMAISPWHLQFSRAAFEGNIGLTFLLTGILFFLKGFKNQRLFFLSGISFVLSMYSYHSFRLIVPILVFFGIILFFRQMWQKKLFFLLSLVLMGVFILPIFQSVLSTQGTGARLSMVSVFASPQVLDKSINRLSYDQDNNEILGNIFHNRRITYVLVIAKGYLDHFNPDFLFLHGDGGRQHHAVDVGMLYLWELPFILAGFVLFWQKLDRRVLLFFLLFFLSPIASAISTGTPHPVRAIAMIPAFHIFTAAGVIAFYLWIVSKKTIIKFSIFGITFLLFIFNFTYYLHQYYVHTPIEYGDFWQYGHKEVFKDLGPIEDKYSKVVMTYMYDQPYIYYLFYNKVDPSWYQKNWDYQGTGETERFRRIIGKYEFRNIDWGRDKNLKNTLFIGAPSEIPDNANIIKEIKYLDGSIAFRIAQT